MAFPRKETRGYLVAMLLAAGCLATSDIRAEEAIHLPSPSRRRAPWRPYSTGPRTPASSLTCPMRRRAPSGTRRVRFISSSVTTTIGLISAQRSTQSKQNCSVIHEAHRSPVLAQFDDLELDQRGLYQGRKYRLRAGPHGTARRADTRSMPGGQVFRLPPEHGDQALCPTDGGRSFLPAGNGGRPPVVATLPMPIHRPDIPGRICQPDEHHRTGRLVLCLYVRRRLQGPEARQLPDPHEDSRRSIFLARLGWKGLLRTLCRSLPRCGAGSRSAYLRPVAPQVINRMIGGLVTHRDSGAVIAIFGDKRPQPDGRVVEGIFTATSATC